MASVMSTAEVQADAADPAPVDRQDLRRWWILGVLSIAKLMVVLDSTVVNIALPSAQRALGFSTSDRQWVVTAYALAFGSLLLLGGRLADMLGRRRMFLIGLAGFAGASAVGGAAVNFDMLVGARAIQGAFAAVLAPAGLSLLTTTFTRPEERGKAFGIYGAIAGGGAAVGLLLGGVLTEYLSWRWCMYVNLAFAAVAFTGAILLLDSRRDKASAHLDVPGILTVSAGLFSLVFGFSHAETANWSSAVTIGFLAASALLLASFAYLQTRVVHPVLPLRVVLDRNRGGSLLALLFSGAGMFAVFLFLTYYLQATLGYSAVKTGLAFMPMTAALVTAATMGSTLLSTRVGPRWMVGPGMALAMLGMVILTTIGLHGAYVSRVLPATIAFGFGVGLIFSSSISNATARLAPADAGAGSAVVTTMQQVGGSIGTALLNTIAASAAAGYIATHGAQAAGAATVHSYTTIFWWAAGLFALGAVVCGSVLRGDVPEVDPNAEEVLAV
jgi:EmrB/QacA subfamily drug resistance transporter